MTDHALTELLDDEAAPFFAPVSSDAIDMLIGQYDAVRRRIQTVAEFVADSMNGDAIHYFIEGNYDDQKGRMSLKSGAAQLFDPVGAIGSLNASYWSKALQLTDVIDAMPQKRRNEWNEQMRNPLGKKAQARSFRGGNFDQPEKVWEVEPLPDFTEETVRSTLQGLLALRAQFLGERVDGIFQGLSGEHVTNAPEGFGKRMILTYGMSHEKAGLLNDLRCVVAKFMGRDEPKYSASLRLEGTLKRNYGEWVILDGGAVKVKLYKKGTVHIEVHPDMAWRLNSILAHLYPLAIPASFRERPKRKAKAFEMLGKPLPFAVLEVLGQMDKAYNWYEKNYQKYREEVPNSRTFGYDSAKDANVRRMAEEVLRAIGGVEVSHGTGTATRWQFDYHPTPVLDQVISSGCIPDQRAHQFYPTPAAVAEAAIEMADIGPDDLCLEPSAGLGGLADLMPKDHTLCVEIAPLHCAVLEAKGFRVHAGDFIAFADNTVPRPQFDRIVMNPPFSAGRAKTHTERAFGLLKPGGVLVAILPASMRGVDFLEGATTWSRVHENEFAGTSTNVVLMKVQRAA